MTKRKGASGSPSRTPVLMVKGSVSPSGVTTETVVSLYKIYCVNNSGGNSIGDKNLKHSRAINGVKGFSEIDKRDDCFLLMVSQLITILLRARTGVDVERP